MAIYRDDRSDQAAPSRACSNIKTGNYRSPLCPERRDKQIKSLRYFFTGKAVLVSLSEVANGQEVIVGFQWPSLRWSIAPKIACCPGFQGLSLWPADGHDAVLPLTGVRMAVISTSTKSRPATASFFRVNKQTCTNFLGDCRAVQGDGECNGMGPIENHSYADLRAAVEKGPARLNHPRIKTSTHICTLSRARPLEVAMRIAFEELVCSRTIGNCRHRKAMCSLDKSRNPDAPRWSILSTPTSERSTKVSFPNITFE
jgi:hypothetical protein